MRLSLFCLLMLLNLMIAAGCSSGGKDDAATQKIHGTWVDELGISAEYKSDGTYLIDFGSNDVEKGKYSIKNDTLITESEDGILKERILKLDADSLVTAFTSDLGTPIRSAFGRKK